MNLGMHIVEKSSEFNLMIHLDINIARKECMKLHLEHSVTHFYANDISH